MVVKSDPRVVNAPPGQTVLGPAYPSASYQSGGRVLVDGIAGLHFHAETLHLSVVRADRLGSSSRLVAATPGVWSDGWIRFEVVGLDVSGGMPYRRTFDLFSLQQVALPVGTFRDVRVNILAATAIGYDAAAVFSTQATSTEGRAYLVLGTEDDTGGVPYRVPDGAIAMTPAVADPGFVYGNFYGNGKGTTVASPAFVGVEQDVAGTIYQPTINNFRALWRIRM